MPASGAVWIQVSPILPQHSLPRTQCVEIRRTVTLKFARRGREGEKERDGDKRSRVVERDRESVGESLLTQLRAV